MRARKTFRRSTRERTGWAGTGRHRLAAHTDRAGRTAVQGLDAALGILSVFDTSGAGVTCELDQRTFPKDRSVVRDTKARHEDLRAIEFVAMPDFRVNFNVVGNFAWVDAPATFEGTTVQGYPLLQDIRFRFAGIDGELIDQLWVSKASIELSGSDNALLHEDRWIGIPFDFEIDFDPVGAGAPCGVNSWFTTRTTGRR